jgi:ABC-type spermidine/putrescine transport system permease subunit I
MIAGFMIVIIMALGFLYLSQFYGNEQKASPETFLANPASDGTSSQ